MSKAIYRTLNQYLSHKSSRRDFLQALTAMGVTSLSAESLLAFTQQNSAGISPEHSVAEIRKKGKV